MVEEKKSVDWISLITGICFIIVSFIAFKNPYASLASLVIYFGIIAIVKGVGGVLIYSTCTIGNIENRENFDYIKNMETMEVIPIDGKDYIEFVSFKENTDGFFISKFKKKWYERKY